MYAHTNSKVTLLQMCRRIAVKKHICFLQPPACCSRLLVSPNVVLFVMRATPLVHRILCCVELNRVVKAVDYSECIRQNSSFIFLSFLI